MKFDGKIREHFKDRERFCKKELYEYYKKHEPDLKSQTFAWRLHELKKRNIIQEVMKGFYIISERKTFDPVIDERMREIYSDVIKEFFDLKLNIWSTAWINEFARHQTFQNFYILETPQDTIESVFYKMKELEIPNVFLKPDKEHISRYVIGEKDSVVVINLVTKSPVRKKNKVSIPILEKVLVDLYCDTVTFYMYQGYELKEIFRAAMRKYTLNSTKFLHYARRRERENEIKKYMLDNFKEQVKGFVNDK